jgi:poly(3-hydroxybutyrate) depolymerase
MKIGSFACAPSHPASARPLLSMLTVLMSFFLTVLPISGVAQVTEAARSPANLEALSRVQIRAYEMPQAGGERIEYGLFVPSGYRPAVATPLVVALHGLGSGPMYMMEYSNLPELAERYGFIVVTPMGYNPRGWYGSRGADNAFNGGRPDTGPDNLGELSEQDVMNVLAIARRDFNVDPSRIYLIGQSMGGGGTLHLAMKHAGIWAAAAALAPAIYSDPTAISAAREVPFMVVMGDADELVDVEVTRRWVEQMRELGMTHEYIEVPGGSHSSAGRDNIDRVFAFIRRY